MRKIVSLLLGILLLVSITACGAKPTVLKEIPYVPYYSSNMTLDSHTPPGKGKSNTSATYLIKNTTNKDVLNNYVTILENNGWTITKNLSPVTVTAKKDSHSLALLPVQVSNDVKLTIVAN